MREKPLAWLGASLDDVRAFPEDARREAGHQLGRVREGLWPTDWKPMASVGAGVIEIRVHTRLEHRVFYVAKFDDARLHPARIREANQSNAGQRDRAGAQAPRRSAPSSPQ